MSTMTRERPGTETTTATPPQERDVVRTSERPDAPRSEPWGRRLMRGGLAGIVFGIVFIALNGWFAMTTGGRFLDPFALISTIVLGAGTTNVWLGAGVHVALSFLFGAVFGLFTPLFRNNGTLALAGGLYGAALFAINFLLIGQLWLTQFAATNFAFELVVHVVWGHLLALAFYGVGVRSHQALYPIGTRNRTIEA